MLGKLRWLENKRRSRTVNDQPTLADQSQAPETDINVIVPRFLKTGQAPGPTAQPITGDFTQLPQGLREMIELTREMGRLRRELPEKLQQIEVDQLLEMDPKDLAELVNPKKDEPKKEEAK